VSPVRPYKIYVLFKVVDSSGCSTISKIRWSKYTEIERCCHLILKNRARLENRKRSSHEHTTQRYYSATFTPDTRGHKFSQAHDAGEPRILIVRRSQRVGSYQGHWAGISGFVEPGVTPDEQAYTEIREETGLQREQVRMLRRGSVVEHLDPSLNRHFYIHPYLFEALTPEAIHTDWEAVERRWILPSELSNYDTVPKLQEVYASAINGEAIQ